MKKFLYSVFMISLSIAVVMLSPFIVSGFAAHNSNSLVCGVIDEELSQVISFSSEFEYIPVAIWIEETDLDAIEKKALAETGMNRSVITEMEAKGEELSNNQIEQYISAERRIYSDHQKIITDGFINDHNSIFQNDPFGKRNTYSRYSPVIFTELTSSEIRELSLDGSVYAIYYSPLQCFSEESEFPEDHEVPRSTATDTFLAAIRVSNVHALNYYGDGIKIGQLELDIPNKTEFPGASITICQGETGTSTHATRVMELLLKVAPNAQYYCTTSDNGFEQAVEWLIDQGVNIITNSAGSSATGQYTAQEVWLDHLAINHSVHFVKSAGNNGNYITRPGMAYNIITVGAANSSLNGRWTNSSFNEYGTLGSGNVYPDKPDIIAPGESWFFDTPTGASGSSSGTSYAAPIVTGVVALMMQSRPALKTLQDSVKSCLLASINNSTLRFVPGTSGYHQCGAGLIDAYSSVYTALNRNFTRNQYFAVGSSVDTVKTFYFDSSNSDTIKRVSLTWLKYNKISNSPHYSNTPAEGAYVDMDLIVKDSNGVPMGQSNITYGNVEVVQFTPSPGETYTVEVSIKNSPAQKAYFSVAWW